MQNNINLVKQIAPNKFEVEFYVPSDCEGPLINIDELLSAGVKEDSIVIATADTTDFYSWQSMGWFYGDEECNDEVCGQAVRFSSCGITIYFDSEDESLEEDDIEVVD